MNLKVSTPERVVLELSGITMLSADGVEGQFAILNNHIPFTTKLNDGIIKIKTAEGTQLLATGPAFFEVNKNNIIILTDSAILPSEADKLRAEEVRKKAEEQLEKKLEGTDFQKVEAELRKALLELKLVNSTQG